MIAFPSERRKYTPTTTVYVYSDGTTTTSIDPPTGSYVTADLVVWVSETEEWVSNETTRQDEQEQESDQEIERRPSWPKPVSERLPQAGKRLLLARRNQPRREAATVRRNRKGRTMLS